MSELAPVICKEIWKIEDPKEHAYVYWQIMFLFSRLKAWEVLQSGQESGFNFVPVSVNIETEDENTSNCRMEEQDFIDMIERAKAYHFANRVNARDGMVHWYSKRLYDTDPFSCRITRIRSEEPHK